MVNDTSASRSIQALRQRYALELVEVEKRVSAIRAKVQVLDELLAEQNNGQATIPSTDAVNGIPDGITEATLWTLAKHASNGINITSGPLRDYMLAAGYKPKGKNFAGTLHTTLQRLMLSERILGEKHNGVWFYAAKT